MEQFAESTKPLLRPQQIDEMHDEKRRLENTLKAPAHITAQIQDVGAMRRQLRALNTQLATQTPEPYAPQVIDQAVAREKKLRKQFTAGMPTQAEMRKTPTGAVDKHINWERRNKQAIMEWKNIRLRLQVSGGIDGITDGRDVANIERYRPAGGAGELPMHNPLISGKDFHLPPNIEVKNVADDDQKATWAKEKLELIEKMALDGDPMYQRVWEEISGEKKVAPRRTRAQVKKES